MLRRLLQQGLVVLLQRRIGLFQLLIEPFCLNMIGLELLHLGLEGLVGFQQLPVVVL